MEDTSTATLRHVINPDVPIPTVITTESLIEFGQKKFGDAYDFSKVYYNPESEKHRARIICPNHGKFKIGLKTFFHRDVLCPRCLGLQSSGEAMNDYELKLRRYITETFGDRIDASNMVFAGRTKYVELVCVEHGPFLRSPRGIMSSRYGCFECAKRAHLEHNRMRMYENGEHQNRVCIPDINPNIQKPLNSFVAIDFETFYSNPLTACSVGLVKFVDGVIVDKYYSLIKPPFDFPNKKGVPNTHIHGFTEEMLVNERTFDLIYPEIAGFIGNMPLVAHGSGMERACILYCCTHYGIGQTIDISLMIDTYPLSRAIEDEFGIEATGERAHSLVNVCKRFRVNVLEHHHALNDAVMCGELMVKLHQIKGMPNH